MKNAVGKTINSFLTFTKLCIHTLSALYNFESSFEHILSPTSFYTIKTAGTSACDTISQIRGDATLYGKFPIRHYLRPVLEASLFQDKASMQYAFALSKKHIVVKERYLAVLKKDKFDTRSKL